LIQKIDIFHVSH